jgi:hypothetical protein
MPSPPTKPTIQYPCAWTYTVIGQKEPRLLEAIHLVMGDRKFDVDYSRESHGGHYCSLTVEVTVADEAERLALFEALRTVDGVNWVL